MNKSSVSSDSPNVAVSVLDSPKYTTFGGSDIYTTTFFKSPSNVEANGHAVQ